MNGEHMLVVVNEWWTYACCSQWMVNILTQNYSTLFLYVQSYMSRYGTFTLCNEPCVIISLCFTYSRMNSISLYPQYLWRHVVYSTQYLWRHGIYSISDVTLCTLYLWRHVMYIVSLTPRYIQYLWRHVMYRISDVTLCTVSLTSRYVHCISDKLSYIVVIDSAGDDAETSRRAAQRPGLHDTDQVTWPPAREAVTWLREALSSGGGESQQRQELAPAGVAGNEYRVEGSP